MKLYVGLTDQNWFEHLAGMTPQPDEINFWRPGGRKTDDSVMAAREKLVPNQIIYLIEKTRGNAANTTSRPRVELYIQH